MKKTTANIISVIIFINFVYVPATLAATLSNVFMGQVNNNIVVTYDLSGSKEEHCDISIVFIIKNPVSSIVPNSLTGDFKNVAPGKGKKIIWNASNDIGTWIGQMKVILNINVSKSITELYSSSEGGYSSNVFLSMLCPGLGDVFVNGNENVKIKPGYITAGFAISVAFALYSHQEMKNYYSAYSSSVQQYEINDNYYQAEYYRKNANFFAVAAACIWAGDIIHVLIKGINNKQGINNYGILKHKKAFELYAGTSHEGLFLKLQF